MTLCSKLNHKNAQLCVCERCCWHNKAGLPGTICTDFAWIIIFCNNIRPDTARQGDITRVAVLNDDHSVGEVDDKVAEDVGQELLVDQLVHRPLPFVENFHENTETAGIGHITSIGYCHCCWFGSDIQFVEMTKLESCVNTNALNFVTTFFLSIVFCSSIVLFTPYSIIGFQLLIDRSFALFSLKCNPIICPLNSDSNQLCMSHRFI